MHARQQQQQQPRFAQLEVLDLSRSAGLNGRPVKFQLDDLQAAMPNLRVLKLSGLGGPLYGERCRLPLGHACCWEFGDAEGSWLGSPAVLHVPGLHARCSWMLQRVEVVA